MDELNFPCRKAGKLDAAELAGAERRPDKSAERQFHSIGQITDYPDNVDFYVHLPDVTGTGQLGDYY